LEAITVVEKVWFAFIVFVLQDNSKSLVSSHVVGIPVKRESLLASTVLLVWIKADVMCKKGVISGSAEGMVPDLEPINAAAKHCGLDLEVLELERDLLVGDCDGNLAVFIALVLVVIDLRLSENDVFGKIKRLAVEVANVFDDKTRTTVSYSIRNRTDDDCESYKDAADQSKAFPLFVLLNDDWSWSWSSLLLSWITSICWCWGSRRVTLGSSILLDVHNNRLLHGRLLSVLWLHDFFLEMIEK